MGHFLVQAGVIDSRTIRRYEKESKEIGKASFAFAWVLDERPEEVRPLVCVLYDNLVHMSWPYFA